MSFLFSPRKMFGLVGGTVGVYLCVVVGLFVLIAYVTIQQLPFGQVDAWRWFVGEPRPVGVVDASSVTGLGLDPSILVEWFGGHVTSGFHNLSRPGHNGIDFSLVEGRGAPQPHGMYKGHCGEPLGRGRQVGNQGPRPLGCVGISGF